MSVRRAQFELSAVSGPVNCQTHSTTHTATETKHTHGTRTEPQQQWWWCVFCDEDAAAARLGPTSPSGKNRATTSTTAQKNSREPAETASAARMLCAIDRLKVCAQVKLQGLFAGRPFLRVYLFSVCSVSRARALSRGRRSPSHPLPRLPRSQPKPRCVLAHTNRGLLGEETTASDAAGFRFRFPPKGP